MSLVTCCPACGTLFKVVADQLRISEGWVRCGHCSEVFDAGAHLHPPAPGPVPAGLAPAGAAVPAGEAPVAQPAPAAPARAPAPAAPVARLSAAPVPTPVAAKAMLADAAAAPQAPAPPAPENPPYPPFVLVREDDSVLDSQPPPSVPPRRQVRHEVESGWHESWNSSELPPGPTQWPASELPIPDSALDDADGPALDKVSFVRQARRRAFWRRGSVRAVMLLLALALLATLAAQVAVHQRDRLAADRPALRPLLEGLCRPLGCSIGPVRSIESIVIDSSSFRRLRPDAYRLSVTLKNQAGIPVAMPSLELTLTDTQDQPVLRRVLAPAALGPAVPATLAPGGEWSTALTVAVTADGGAGRISGYRLLAFYP